MPQEDIAFQDCIYPGVRELDHTADVGIEVHAASPKELFHRAAGGLFALVYGEDSFRRAGRPGGASERVLDVEAADFPALLVRWLRELLYIQETDGARYLDAAFEELIETRLSARVRVAPADRRPTREIKGVTYHDLEVTRDSGEWRARVVFDV
jgi:SHS2 domain-containing protein